MRKKTQNQAKTIAKAKRGRVRKTKPKKPIKINGLDLLHSQTLLSTSPQGTVYLFIILLIICWYFCTQLLELMSVNSARYDIFKIPFADGKKLPPAPGCVDQQLTALSTKMIHHELDIPKAPNDTPYALQILLDMYRIQYMNMIDQMKSVEYKDSVQNYISEEKVSHLN